MTETNRIKVAGVTVMKDTRASKANEVATGVADAVRSMNVEALGSYYADDIVVWHNFDSQTQTKQQNLDFLRDILSRCASVSYEKIERHLTGFGYLQQHVLTMVLVNGRSATIPCCHIVRIRDGLICRFDEYFDPAPFYQLLAA